MAENQVYLIKSGQNSFVEETNAIIGIDNAGRVGIGTTNPEVDFHVTGSAKIGGNLTVDGTLTTINSNTVSVDDINIELGGTDNPTDATADGGGITLKGATDKTFNWVDATDAWTSSEHLHLAAGKRFSADAIRALGAGGLSVGDDAGNGIFVEDGGKVGIGTTNPAYDLDVNGSGNFNSLYVGGNAVLTTADGDLGKWDGETDIYYTAGKVGVSNDSPDYNLHVSGDAAVDGNFIVNGTSGNLNVESLNVSGEYINIGYVNDGLNSDRGGIKVIDPDGTGKFEYVASSDLWQLDQKLEIAGDLDIGGSASIDRNLTIGGNLTVNGTTTTVNTETLEIEDHNLVIASNVDHTQLTNDHPDGTSEYAGILWGTGDGRPSLTYQSNKGFSFKGGNVGIGTTSPASAGGYSKTLQVSDSNSASIILSRTSTTASSIEIGTFSASNLIESIGSEIPLRFKVDGQERMRIDSDGNVGIGTTNPGYDLDVAGTGNFSSAVQAPLMLQNGNTVVDQGDVGSEPNQIPLNKDLGTLAYMDAPEIEDINVDTLELREIAAEISETAVDVFVYDTRKDSDGGAWRNRTSHTSWYNEPLNTATRGGRREFPAVAVIVAEADKVTIYDGDDPDLNMWMVFDDGGNNAYLMTRSATCISAINGSICAGCDDNNNYGHILYANFISDIMQRWSKQDGYTESYRSGTGISTRNGTFENILDTTTPNLVNKHINDVAMTVLPNAPIDANTGLPVPTIAVATDGGVSVIKDDGTVSNLTPGGGEVMTSCDFDLDYNLVLGRNSFILIRSDYPHYLSNQVDSGYAINNRKTTIPSVGEDSTALSTFRNVLGISSSFVAYDTETLGLGLYSKSDNNSSSMVAKVASSYNTGWMPGDIKLAALSDTKIEKVGVDETTELITNITDRDFSGPLVEWSGDITPIGGEGVISDPSSVSAVLNLSGLTAGKKYTMSFEIISITTGTPRMYMDNTVEGKDALNYTTGLHYKTFTASGETATATFYVFNAGGGTYNVDNFSVKQTGELITNGTFDNGTEGWDDRGTSSLSVASGELVITGAAYSGAQQEISTVVGKKYIISGNRLGPGLSYVQVGTTSGTGGNSYNIINNIDDTGPFAFEFTASTTSTFVTLQLGNYTGAATFDNISVRLDEEDRSVNDNGLQVFGEIDKTPVEPGADLVAYSGFSAENYLMQPYNPDLDFGTGDFSIMGWFNAGSSTGVVKAILAQYDIYGATTPGYYSRTGFNISIHTDGSFYFYSVSNGTLEYTPYSNAGASLHTNTWNHFCVNRTGGYIKTYINGSEYSSATTEVMNLNTHSPLYVGHSPVNHVACEGGLSLLRISKTAPTDAQIAKIYRDEKVLFTDGAQSTLYGTSDAVTALAYDDSDDLLHVGTASGRSVFNGLKRVDNTDVAVTTAISAKKGFVIAQ